MKKSRKIGMAVILAGLFMTVFSGCGKSDDAPQNEKREFVYVPEYVQLAMECDYINSVAAAGDNVFICADSYGEDYSSTLYQYNLLENKVEKQLITLDEKTDGSDMVNTNLGSMTVGPDGNLLMILNHYEYITDENEEIIDSKLNMELCKISAKDGSVMESADITGVLNDDEWMYIQYMCVDAKENIYLYDGNNDTIYVLNKDMQKVCEISNDGWIRNMVISKEGDVYVALYGNEGGEEFKKIDVEGKKLGENVSSISEANLGGDYYTGTSTSLLVSGNNDQLSTFDLEAGTGEVLFKWLDADVNSDNLAYVGELSDGRIWAITREYDYSGSGETSYELVYLSRKAASEVEEKEEILYGALWLGSELRKNIIDFNKSNDKYRIVVKEYAGEDYQAGMTQFNADLTTGNCPDIIDLVALDFNQYASKGILEDLYPYMEQSGIRKEDYLENILGAFEIDGKLYGIMPQFYILTTMAKSSLVGDISGWTLSEMLDFVEKYEPENVFAYGSRSSIFYYCIYNNIDEFIDWETGKCSFEGDAFIRTLEFAAKFPEEFDYGAEREGTSAMLRANKLLLMQQSISSVQEYQMMNGMFGEKISYVGYPNSERNGNLIQATTGSMGMSAKSKHKDGAWEFMKNIISQEYQDKLVERGNWGFPVKKSSLEKQFEMDMEAEYYEDEEGNQVEQPKTSWGYDDFQMDIMAATQEEVDAVRELIMSARKTSGNADEQLINIITEETEPFFKGQKSAADTAGIIQNRIQIYVNENR